MNPRAEVDRDAADRSLDRLVAEKVMGFCLHEPGMTRDLTHLEAECRRCEEMVPYLTYAKQAKFIPSTDLASAWTVVERLREMGWLVTMKAMPDGFPFTNNEQDWELHARALVELMWMPLSTKEDWHKRINRHPRANLKRDRAVGHAATMAEAICRAALDAVVDDGS